MKFNVEELKQFRKELDQTLKQLADKYEIDITLGKIQVIDDMFSIRLNAEHTVKKTETKPVVKKTTKVEKPKKDIDNLDDEDLNNLDVSSIDFDSLADTSKKIKEVAKDVTKPQPRKPIVPEKVKKEVKKDNVVNKEKIEPKPINKTKEKDLDTISDSDLNSLDLDSLDLDSLVDDEVENSAPKKEEVDKPKINQNSKVETPKAKKKIEDLTDEELENLDLDEIDFGDEEEEKPKVKKDEDDDSRYEQELERYLAPKVKKQDNNPRNVFEEKELYSEDSEFSDEEIDEYIKSKNLFNYSFQAKLIQSDPKVQDLYTDIKNLLLSNEGVKSKVLWDFDDFVYNKKSIAKLEIDGDSLVVYLALDPLDYEGSYDVSRTSDPKYQSTKLKVVLNDINDEDQMYDLIGDLAESYDIMPGEDRYDDYHFQYETDEELMDRGLIKEN